MTRKHAVYQHRNTIVGAQYFVDGMLLKRCQCSLQETLMKSLGWLSSS